MLISADMAMGLTTGNRNGLSAGPSDFDDSWALALAASRPDEIDVRGIVVTMGNGPLSAEMAAAEATVDALDIDPPVVPGASVWLPMKSIDGPAGEPLDDSCVNEGVEFMAEAIAETPGITVLALGPLTDLACLSMAFPHEASQIGEVVALVGSEPDSDFSFDGANLEDFNFQMDPRAASIVLEKTEIPFTAITFELSSSTGVPVERILALADSDDPTARFFGEASSAYAEFWRTAVSSNKPVWDATVVWHLFAPESYSCQKAGYRLKTGPPGATATDAYDWFSPEYDHTRTVTACTSFTSDAGIDRFREAVFNAIGE